MGIDWSFISAREGGRQLKGYVPAATTSRSGVTIGTGGDLGQRSATDIEGLDISQALKEKLKPYAEMTGVEAESYLKSHPLEVTDAEAKAFDAAIKAPIVAALKLDYNAASVTRFDDLPDEAQTVIASVCFQYGKLSRRTPTFWRLVTGQQWQEAVAELRDFGDNYGPRRILEADVLEKIL